MMERNDPIYVISVAAKLAHMHPQTLRQYDRMGLVVPRRQGGKHRRYSAADIARLRRVQELSNEGISLEGARRVLDLESQAEALREEIQVLRASVLHWRDRAQADGQNRVFTAGATGEVSVESARLAQARAAFLWEQVTRQRPFELTAGPSSRQQGHRRI
ncbi:MerR family transcriptional regulator [Galactobacter sp.]|uniref:heat shock protein transcriptional repressor HspR n=1 Tax=Galactobacter sp. TaxID=2676125 RepID=UPI0025B9043E|nr:MerR family transcriptional regulator [Galactobacter sp.]